MTRRVYVDADGVLVNFNKAFAPAFGLEYPKSTVLYYDWLMNSANVSAPEFFRTCETHSYLWERAEPYPWTSDIVQVLDLACPEWMILTSATFDPDCWSGKVKCYKRLFTEDVVRKLILIGENKARIANKDDILVDDRHDNVMAWREAGGVAFHWTDYAEDMRELAADQVHTLSSFLNEHLGWLDGRRLEPKISRKSI